MSLLSDFLLTSTFIPCCPGERCVLPRLHTRIKTAPMPLPRASGPLPIFLDVKTRLGQRSSITASVCKRNTGNGTVELKKSAKRRRIPQSTTAQSIHFSTTSSSPLQSADSGEQSKYHRRRWLLRLHRADDHVSLSSNVSDTEHGSVSVKLCPSNKIDLSLCLKRIFSFPPANNNMFLKPKLRKLFMFSPPGVTQGSDSTDRQLLLNHEFKYKWNERSLTAIFSLEAAQYIASVRVRNNPLRITPKIQIPLWKRSETTPCLCWEHEPKSGPGEVQLLRKPFKLSFEVQRRRVGICHLSKSGSITKVSLDSQSAHLEHTMTHIFKGALVTTTSALSNHSCNSGVTVSATAPWGKVAAFGSPTMFSMSSDAMFFCSQRRQYRAAFEVENFSQFAFRLGAFY